MGRWPRAHCFVQIAECNVCRRLVVVDTNTGVVARASRLANAIGAWRLSSMCRLALNDCLATFSASCCIAWRMEPGKWLSLLGRVACRWGCGNMALAGVVEGAAGRHEPSHWQAHY